MAAPSFLVTNYSNTGNTASDIIGLVEARLTAAGWVFVEEYAFTQNLGGNGTTTSGSTTLASVFTTTIQNGWSVGGAGIPAGSYVVSGGGTNTLVLSQAATASATVALTASRAMRVWKNPASLNASGADFYVGFVKDTTGGPRLAVRAFEIWDATNKVIGNPVIAGNATPAANSSTYAATVASNGTGTGSAYWNPTGVTTPLMVDTQSYVTLVNNTNYDVAVLASKSYLVLSIANNGSSGMWAGWIIGLYNPAWSDSQSTYVPLAVMDMCVTTSYNSAFFGVSRAMRQITTANSNWSAAVGPESMLFGLAYSGGLSKERGSQAVRGSRVMVGSYGPPFNNSGAYRGTLYDAMVLASDTSLKIGDTVSVGATTWTVLAPYVNAPAFAVSSPTAVQAMYLFNTTAGS